MSYVIYINFIQFWAGWTPVWQNHWHNLSPALSSDTWTSHNLSPTRVTHHSHTTLKGLDINVRHLSHNLTKPLKKIRPHYPLTNQRHIINLSPTRVTHQSHTTLKGLDINARHLSHNLTKPLKNIRPHYPPTHQRKRWRGWTSMLDTCLTISQSHWHNFSAAQSSDTSPWHNLHLPVFALTHKSGKSYIMHIDIKRPPSITEKILQAWSH